MNECIIRDFGIFFVFTKQFTLTTRTTYKCTGLCVENAFTADANESIVFFFLRAFSIIVFN